MPGMHPQPAQIHWHITTLAVAVLSAAMLAWWLTTRARVPAVIAAAGLIEVCVSDEVRVMAIASHLVAMAALEGLLVAAPLLLVAALPRRSRPAVSSLWTAGVVVAVMLNSALLIALHLPAVHDRGMDLASVPLWLTGLALVIGLGYWAAILLTAGRVRSAVRRGALVIGQEVAAILGLAALIRPSPAMRHADPLGLSPVTDQRVGGLLMLITCAAVTLPLAKRLEAQQLRSECNVH